MVNNYINNTNYYILQVKYNERENRYIVHYCCPNDFWCDDNWQSLESFKTLLECAQYWTKICRILELSKPIGINLIKDKKLRNLVLNNISVCFYCKKEYKDKYNYSNNNCGDC